MCKKWKLLTCAAGSAGPVPRHLWHLMGGREAPPQGWQALSHPSLPCGSRGPVLPLGFHCVVPSAWSAVPPPTSSCPNRVPTAPSPALSLLEENSLSLFILRQGLTG